ncbi:hypothetical protein DVV81_11435 [Clostridium botulinum]|uniref:hypothetical protein n=1 Tax=Clostridium botulinum TaxID=1491 RepID=UPI0019677C47|nr:hypothetical protein [Clostridium botulinum]MBN1071777.1 hypothetical protein [Clostridium botulinum]
MITGKCIVCNGELDHYDKPVIAKCSECGIREKYFWASTNKLFRLDSYFNEVDFLNINFCKNCGSIITGISYNCGNDMLIIAFKNCIISCDKFNNSKCTTVAKSCIA